MPKKYVKPINRYSWYHAQDVIEEVIPDNTLPIGVASLPEGTLLYRDTSNEITVLSHNPANDNAHKPLGVLVNHSVVDEELANIAVRGTFGDVFLRQVGVIDKFEADGAETEFELSHALQTFEGKTTIHGVAFRENLHESVQMLVTDGTDTYELPNDITDITLIEQWVPDGNMGITGNVVETTPGVAPVKQVLRGTVGVVSAASADIEVTVTAAAMNDSPKDVTVTLAAGDSLSSVAGKVVAALKADADVNGFFDIEQGTLENTDKIFLTAKDAAGNDDTMDIAVTADVGTTNVVITGAIAVAGNAGTLQVNTLTVTGTVLRDGNLELTITSAGMDGSPYVIPIEVAEDDEQNDVGLALRTALDADEVVDAFFTVAGGTNTVTFTADEEAANDATFAVAIAHRPFDAGSWVAIAEGDDDNGWSFADDEITFVGTAIPRDGSDYTPAGGDEGETLRVTYEHDIDNWLWQLDGWSIEKGEHGETLLVFTEPPDISDTDEDENILIAYDDKPSATEIHMFEPAIVIRPVLETETEITYPFMEVGEEE